MKLLLTVLLALCFGMIKAQPFHMNVFIGTANYQGDLQEKKFAFRQSHFAAGVGLSYEITDQLSARINFTAGKIGADDEVSGKNIQRNLNFTSSISELMLGMEYQLLNPNNYQAIPYVFAGVASYHFNPYTFNSADEKVYLQPLGTEGQGFYQGREKYKLTQISIPLGAGIKFPIDDNITLGLEVGFRKLFTDYLDDVSTTYVPKALLLANNGQQAVDLSYRGDETPTAPKPYPTTSMVRGNPKHKDWYYFTGISFDYRMPAKESKTKEASSNFERTEF